MAVAAAMGGVDSVALEGESRDKVGVVGEGVDSIKLVSALRKEGGTRGAAAGRRGGQEGRQETPAARRGAIQPAAAAAGHLRLPPLLPPCRLRILLVLLLLPLPLDAAGHHLLQPP